jgi:hypothetical protein
MRTGTFALVSAVLLWITPSNGFGVLTAPPTTTVRNHQHGTPHGTPGRTTASRRLLVTRNIVCVMAATKGESVPVPSNEPRTRGSKKSTTVVSANDSIATTKAAEAEVAAPTKKRKKAKKKSSKEKKEVPSKHWRIDTDEFILHNGQCSEFLSEDAASDGSNNDTWLRFTVRGNPLPLRRHRTARGFVYNPSAPAQASFRQIVQSLVFPDLKADSSNGDDDEPEPLFSHEYSLAMTIVFRTKRPKYHFVGSKPAPDRLKKDAPTQTTPTRTDVDNLAKFVLDSCNGLLYTDDKQIASLHVTKLLDNREECQGSTEVCLRVLQDKHVDALLNTTFDLY